MYLIFKALHVFAVIAFLGNITVGLFWKNFADRTKDPAIMAHTIDGIIRADRIFTIPGVVFILIGGIGAAVVGSIPILSTGWLLWSIVLFVISGLAFGPLARAQRGMLTAVKANDMPLYHRLSRHWDIYGSIALIAPLIAVALMILKPALPTLHG
jgi:uncharacterized membrane protein